MMMEKQWLECSGGRSINQLISLEDSYRIDSIVAAIEESLMVKSDLSQAENVVLAVEAMEREVNNGGFEQFFLNSSNQYAPIIIPSLEQIDARKTAEIASLAMRIIGAKEDWFPEAYERATFQAGEAALAELEECDNAYYVCREVVDEKLFEFIKLKQADIQV